MSCCRWRDGGQMVKKISLKSQRRRVSFKISRGFEARTHTDFDWRNFYDFIGSPLFSISFSIVKSQSRLFAILPQQQVYLQHLHFLPAGPAVWLPPLWRYCWQCCGRCWCGWIPAGQAWWAPTSCWCHRRPWQRPAPGRYSAHWRRHWNKEERNRVSWSYVGNREFISSRVNPKAASPLFLFFLVCGVIALPCDWTFPFLTPLV